MARKISKKRETPVELTDKIRALNSRFSAEEIESGVIITNRPPAKGAHTAAAIEQEYTEAALARTIGEMFRLARESEGQSLSRAAHQLSVTKGRVAQIEKPDANLRMATVHKVAKKYGYKVQVTLVPEDKEKQRITAELPS